MLVEDPVFLEKLRKENREFAELEKEHKKLDDELNILHKRKVLTAEEEVLKRRLQKEKLAKKDRMAAIYREGKKIKD